MPRDPISIPPALRPAPPPHVPRLALRPREAAEALGINERTLRDKADAPRIHFGTAVLYPVSALERWLNELVERETEARPSTEPSIAPRFEGNHD